jgi:hypothetical protein
MTFEENHIKAQDAYLRQACDATAEATVARMFDAIGYRPGMVIVPASRIEKLEAALRKISHLDYKSAATNFAVYDAHKIARKALEGEND